MSECTDRRMELGRVGRRVVEAAFDGGDIATDGGVVLLRQVDERLGLSRAAARAMGDSRRAASVEHGMRELLAQRIYGLCCGWQDVTDHNTLRHDLVWQTAVGRDRSLGSAPTLSRLENAAGARQAWALHGVLLDQFVASRKAAPAVLVLDVDATHVPLHGQQERAHLNAHYDNQCYLPLYVFCGLALFGSRLRATHGPGSDINLLVEVKPGCVPSLLGGG